MAMATTFDILPAIDLRGGRVVRLQQGDFDRETTYATEPASVAGEFVSAGARWLHVVDLDGARTGTPAHGRAIAAIIASVGERTRVEVSGGLRTEPAVGEALAAGADRAVVGTAVLLDPALAGRLVDAFGSARIAVAIDVREGLALGHGWTSQARGIDAADAIRRLADGGLETFEVTAIERDGLLGGPNRGLYETLVRVDRVSIIASGGITTLDDLRSLRDIGCAGAIVGRAFYEGRLRLEDALALAADVDSAAGRDA